MTRASDLTPGDVLGDRYTLKRSAWASAIGPVWEARDQILERTVFVQLLDDRFAGDAGARNGFVRAASRVAQVQHAALLRVFDIGEDPPFVVFEHVSGGRLSDRIARGPLRTADAARAALTIARALEALHDAGLTHGSLSPASVTFDTEGRAQVIAIGAAEATAQTPGVDARAEQPEGYRVAGEEQGPAADRYALAALTLHMLTGRPPGGASLRRLSLPSGLSSLLQRALADDPASRPTPDAFIAGLAPLARVQPPKARRPAAIAAEFRWLAPVIVIVVIAVLAVTIGVSLVQQLAEDDPSPSPSPTETAEQGAALSIADVAELDPYGDGRESPDRLAALTDEDPDTEWRTQNYNAIDLDKPGVGVLFDLGEAAALARVTISTELPGWEAQIRVGDEPGDDERVFTEVASFSAAEETEVALPDGTRARYVLLWITRLVEHGGTGEFPHRAEVAEITFSGA